MLLVVTVKGNEYEAQIRAWKPEVEALALEYEDTGSEVAGTVAVCFNIDPDGAVKDAYIVASMVMNPLFEKDLLKVISGWTFENPEDRDATFTYPFVFHKEGYELNGTIESLCVYYLLYQDDAKCAGDVMSRASSNKPVAIREYNRVLEENPNVGGLMIVTLYLDNKGGLYRTSCSYSEIDDQVFKDKIRNWLGSNLPEGEYRNTQILKTALVFEPKGGTAAEPLTESKFNEVVGAYEEFVYYICDSNDGGSAGASLVVEITITPSGRVSLVDIVEIDDVDAATVEDIERAIYGWELPKGVETVTYKYRFDI